jgi:hypothetical protein
VAVMVINHCFHFINHYFHFIIFGFLSIFMWCALHIWVYKESVY